MRIRASPDMDFFRPDEKEESPSLIFFSLQTENGAYVALTTVLRFYRPRADRFLPPRFLSTAFEKCSWEIRRALPEILFILFIFRTFVPFRTSGKNVVACRRFTFFPTFFSSFLYLCCFGPLSIIFHRGDGKVRIRHYVE